MFVCLVGRCMRSRVRAPATYKLWSSPSEMLSRCCSVSTLWRTNTMELRLRVRNVRDAWSRTSSAGVDAFTQAINLAYTYERTNVRTAHNGVHGERIAMGGWMDGWMHGCMDGWMDGWMNEPITSGCTCASRSDKYSGVCSGTMASQSTRSSALTPLADLVDRSKNTPCSSRRGGDRAGRDGTRECSEPGSLTSSNEN